MPFFSFTQVEQIIVEAVKQGYLQVPACTTNCFSRWALPLIMHRLVMRCCRRVYNCLRGSRSACLDLLKGSIAAFRGILARLANAMPEHVLNKFDSYASPLRLL